MRRPAHPARGARPLLLAAAALMLTAPLTGCGLKGALYLPPQKKARVPATPANPAPEAAPATPPAAPAPEQPAPEQPAPASPAQTSQG